MKPNESAGTAKKTWLVPQIRRMSTPRAEGFGARYYTDTYYGS